MSDAKTVPAPPTNVINHVVVSCKTPNGLYLDVMKDGKVVRFQANGSSHPNAVGGFGITPMVPKEHWLQWLSENKSLPVVEKGFIFAQETVASAHDAATEMQNEKTGLEPLPQDNPSQGITKAPEMDGGA
jgi:hypothetical protein